MMAIAFAAMMAYGERKSNERGARTTTMQGKQSRDAGNKMLEHLNRKKGADHRAGMPNRMEEHGPQQP